MNLLLIMTGVGVGVLLLLAYVGYRSIRSTEGDGEHSVPDSGRRGFLTLFGGGAAGVLGTSMISWVRDNPVVADAETGYRSAVESGGDRTGYMVATGTVDHEKNGFDPMDMLVDWDYGDVHETSDGRTVREYEWIALDKTIEIAPGVRFPAWTYEGRVPGPTIRCAEGDRIRIHFKNAGSHPHTIHFHGIHSFEMDGVPGAGPGEIAPGEEFTYEFDAEPYGCHLYHCHSLPLKRHIHKGLYGGFIVDPAEGRPPARELFMIMNGFDTNFDDDNEIYAVNTVAHEFMKRPIPVKLGELIRIYLINVLEFDFVNSIHTHAQFFDYYDHGTSLEPDREQVDTIMQTQAERGIVEVSYDELGQFMFHAHQSEFAELGWMGKFNVVKPGNFQKAMQDANIQNPAWWNEHAVDGQTVS